MIPIKAEDMNTLQRTLQQVSDTIDKIKQDYPHTLVIGEAKLNILIDNISTPLLHSINVSQNPFAEILLYHIFTMIDKRLSIPLSSFIIHNGTRQSYIERMENRYGINYIQEIINIIDIHVRQFLNVRYLDFDNEQFLILDKKGDNNEN